MPNLSLIHNRDFKTKTKIQIDIGTRKNSKMNGVNWSPQNKVNT